jgi:hypothetical protein|nr:MAG TPA: hypothetical protein [Caudoviricetes sp.]
MDKKNIPLSVMMENTKGMMFEAFQQVQEKSNLPAYLMEGIVVDLLSQVRNQKNLELVSDMQRMNQSEQEKQEEGE